MSCPAGMACPRVRDNQLSDAAEADLTERGLQVLEHQVDKVVQLHEVWAARALRCPMHCLAMSPDDSLEMHTGLHGIDGKALYNT